MQLLQIFIILVFPRFSRIVFIRIYFLENWFYFYDSLLWLYSVKKDKTVVFLSHHPHARSFTINEQAFASSYFCH